MSGAEAARAWTVLELLRWTAGYLSGKGIADGRLDAELLLADTLGLKRLDLYLQFDRPLGPDELATFRARVLRRARREPLQYIAGFADFRELRLDVDPRVLIPRPETEVLVGEVLAWAGGRAGLHALDLGTGSGAIALSLAVEGRFERVVATDICEDALAVARGNRDRLARDARVELRRGALFEPVAGERFDVVVSNPPYVAEDEALGLAPEVRDHEPARALFGGSDGLGVVRPLAEAAPLHLRPGGLLALEIAPRQAADVASILEGTGQFQSVSVRMDLAGRERIVLAERSAEA